MRENKKFRKKWWAGQGLGLVAIFLLLFCASSIEASNLKSTNEILSGRDSANDTVDLEFDLSWEDSWRDGVNYDAVWMFFKYSTDSGTTWSHCTMKTSGTTPSGTSAGTGTSVELVIATDLTGGFVQRSATGSGTLDTDDIKFVWDYGTDGLSDATVDAGVKVKMFAVEMVYVPTESFYIGDGDGTTEGTLAFHVTDNTAVQITSELVAGITVDTSTNDDIDTSVVGIDGDGGLDTTAGGPIELPSYPTGYNAFYIMKYELTQGQYRDFLNTLTQAQQATRVADTLTLEDAATHYVMTGEDQLSVANRQTVKAGTDPSDGSPYTMGCDLSDNDTSDEAADGEWVAMNYISWMDLCAYADWAGLRPFTELEYEKAARGTIAPVQGEYAWGSTTSETATTTLTDSGETTEVPNQGNSNYTTSAPSGPFRTGCFADATSTRENGGVSRYGALELSGNATERVVTLGNSTGRAFEGSHGNGALSSNGNATNADWPGVSGGEVTGATGAAERGGSWNDAIARSEVSDRNDAAVTDTTRGSAFGGRLARTA